MNVPSKSIVQRSQIGIQGLRNATCGNCLLAENLGSCVQGTRLVFEVQATGDYRKRMVPMGYARAPAPYDFTTA